MYRSPALFLFILTCFFAFFYPEVAKTYSSLLTLNVVDHDELPRMFRMTPQNTSGSSQMTTSSLKKIIDTLPSKKVILVDLREEPHGYLNNHAISWYVNRNWLNKGKPKEEIVRDENEKLADLSRKHFLFLFKHRKYPVPSFVHRVLSEENLAQELGIGYYRLPLTDHCRPADHHVDAFIEFYKNMPEGSWLHFHCSAGKGRTTTLMAMVDMIKNSRDTSFEEIIARQEFYGGMSLATLPSEQEWKHPHAKGRQEFIKEFYEYTKENPQLELSWTTWKAAREAGAS